MNNISSYIKYSKSLPKDTKPLIKLSLQKLSKNANRKCQSCKKNKLNNIHFS